MPGRPRAARAMVDEGLLSGRDLARWTVQLILILFGTGIVGGVMASMVGGASVVTFPALLAVGLDPVSATASNLVAVSPGNLLAALLDRSQLPPLNRAFVGLVLASVGGAFVGAVLLLATPARLLEVLIPVLLGFATVLFAFSERITDWLRARAHGARRTGAAHERDQRSDAAAGLGLRRLFRRRRRRAAARRDVDRDRRRLPLRQRDQEPGDEPQHHRRLRPTSSPTARCNGRRR